MTAKDIVDAVLRLLGMLISWQVLALVVVIINRQHLPILLATLANRITKAPGGFEFAGVQAAKDAIASEAANFQGDTAGFATFVQQQLDKIPLTAPGTANSAPSLGGRSILWVDDQPSNNVYEGSLFKRLGASVDRATSTDEALGKLQQKAFDLIISDIGRKENGRRNSEAGYDLLATLRRQGIDTPLVFYTSPTTRIDRSKAGLAAGVSTRPDQLLTMVSQVLRG